MGRNKAIKETKIKALKQWQKEKDYDSDAMTFDAMEDDNSYFTQKWQDKHLFDLIKSSLVCNVSEHSDTMAKQIFNSIHSYVMHSEHSLFRSKQSQRFAAAAKQTNEEQKEKQKQDEILQIDFGDSVLIWLSY